MPRNSGKRTQKQQQQQQQPSGETPESHPPRSPSTPSQKQQQQQQQQHSEQDTEYISPVLTTRKQARGGGGGGGGGGANETAVYDSAVAVASGVVAEEDDSNMVAMPEPTDLYPGQDETDSAAIASPQFEVPLSPGQLQQHQEDELLHRGDEANENDVIASASLSSSSSSSSPSSSSTAATSERDVSRSRPSEAPSAMTNDEDFAAEGEADFKKNDGQQRAAADEHDENENENEHDEDADGDEADFGVGPGSFARRIRFGAITAQQRLADDTSVAGFQRVLGFSYDIAGPAAAEKSSTAPSRRKRTERETGNGEADDAEAISNNIDTNNTNRRATAATVAAASTETISYQPAAVAFALHCYEPSAASRRQALLQYSVTPHPRRNALGSVEDVVAYNEVRAALLCECMRFYDTFGCFVGIPDRCMVALHWAICEERNLPWNNAAGVALVRSNAADVRAWCEQSLASLLHSTFSTIATMAIVVRIAARATFDDALAVQAEPNAAFCAALLSSACKSLPSAPVAAAAADDAVSSSAGCKAMRPNEHRQLCTKALLNDPEASVLRAFPHSKRTIRAVCPTVLDNPFVCRETGKQHDVVIELMRQLFDAVLAEVRGEPLSLSAADSAASASSDASAAASASSAAASASASASAVGGKSKRRAGSAVKAKDDDSSSNAMFLHDTLNEETLRQVHGFLKLGADSVMQQLVPLLCLAANEPPQQQQRESIFQDVEGVTRFWKQNGGDAVDLSPLMNPFEQQQQDNASAPQSQLQPQLNVVSSQGSSRLLPHIRDLDAMEGFDRVFETASMSENEDAHDASTSSMGGGDDEFAFTGVPSSLVACLSLLLDLGSRIRAFADEFCCFPQQAHSNSNTNANAEAFAVWRSICNVVRCVVAPHIQVRFGAPLSFGRKEPPTVTALHVHVAAQITKALGARGRGNPHLSVMSLIPRLTADVLLATGRAATYSAGAHSFFACCRAFQFHGVWFNQQQRQHDSNTSTRRCSADSSTPVQLLRTFATCVRRNTERLQKIQREAVAASHAANGADVGGEESEPPVTNEECTFFVGGKRGNLFVSLWDQ